MDLKPKLNYEGGKLVAVSKVQVDTDKDGQPALSVEVKVEIDAMEAVNEIIKNEVPEWLKKLISKEKA